MVDPPELRSHNGVLEVTLHFRSQVTFAGQGPPRYCYVTDNGEESPTLRVRPGDLLIIHFHNDLPKEGVGGVAAADTSHKMSAEAGDCAPGPMNAAVTNLHFHGMNVPPTCHQDDVIDTRIQPGEEFEYRVGIPLDETPGLYWYHPHPHGYSEKQVQGGASGALIVEGIEKARPDILNLHQRVLVLRDQSLTNPRDPINVMPAWDISINYTPVLYPAYKPAVIESEGAAREFWRIVNAGANTIFDLQLITGGVAQPLQIVGLDGVPVNVGAEPPATHILLPPGARAEVVAPMPKAGEQAQVVTRKWDTGPLGDNDPARPIAYVVNRGEVERADSVRKAERPPPANSHPQQENKLLVERHLYFSQMTPNPNEPDTSIFYFITVAGQQPAEYRMDQPPNIVVHQGDVEDWTVENRAGEDHVFHIHQIHFLVLEVDGKPVPNGELLDTINLPNWDGSGPYPSVKLRMDFSDPQIVGTFLYHCHILKHEDMGMMGSIQVLTGGRANHG